MGKPSTDPSQRLSALRGTGTGGERRRREERKCDYYTCDNGMNVTPTLLTTLRGGEKGKREREREGAGRETEA